MELKGLDDKVKTIRITKNQFTIGRLKSCDHMILDGVISRVHATIFCQNGEWLLKDSSSNGVTVQNKCIGHANTVPLHTGDVIVLDPFNRYRYVVAQLLPDESAKTDCSSATASKCLVVDSGTDELGRCRRPQLGSTDADDGTSIGGNLPLCKADTGVEYSTGSSFCPSSDMATDNCHNSIRHPAYSASSTTERSAVISCPLTSAAPLISVATNSVSSTASILADSISSVPLAVRVDSGSTSSTPSAAPVVSGSISSAPSVAPVVPGFTSSASSSAPVVTGSTNSTPSAALVVTGLISSSHSTVLIPSRLMSSAPSADCVVSELMSSAPSAQFVPGSTSSAPSTNLIPSGSISSASSASLIHSGSTSSATSANPIPSGLISSTPSSAPILSVSTSSAPSSAPVVSGSISSAPSASLIPSGLTSSVSSASLVSSGSTSSAPPANPIPFGSTNSAPSAAISIEQMDRVSSNIPSSSSITGNLVVQDDTEGPSAKRRKLDHIDERFSDLEVERQSVRDELNYQRIEYEAERNRLLELISKLEEQADQRLDQVAVANQQRQQRLQDELSEACKQRDELSRRLASTNDKSSELNQNTPSTSRANATVGENVPSSSIQPVFSSDSESGELSRRRDSGVIRNELATYAESELTCSICMEFFIDPVTLQCGHSFCQHCIDTWYVRESRVCPMCRRYAGTYTRSIVLQSCTDALVHRLDQSRRDHYDMLRRERQEAQTSSRNSQTVAVVRSPVPQTPRRGRGRRGSRRGGILESITGIHRPATRSTRSRRGAADGATTRSSSSSRARGGRGRRRGGGRGASSDPVSCSGAVTVEGSSSSSSAFFCGVMRQPGVPPSSSSSSSSSSPTLRSTDTRNVSTHIISSDDEDDSGMAWALRASLLQPYNVGISEHSSPTTSSTHSDATLVPSGDVSTSDTGLDDDEHVTSDGAQSSSSTSSSSVEGFGYYGGYGRCFRCGCRGHWAPGCPFRY